MGISDIQRFAGQAEDEAVRECEVGPGASNSIQGMRVFIVEDEALLALLLEDMLTELGCIMVASAQTIAEALSQVTETSEFDAAILDVHIGGEMIFPVADILVERRVPFIFSSGFSPATLAERYPGTVLLAKPYPAEALAARLAGIRHAAQNAAAVPPARRPVIGRGGVGSMQKRGRIAARQPASN
jgi:CheY-like chemotaxis protein